jgi:hypothetical protein
MRVQKFNLKIESTSCSEGERSGNNIGIPLHAKHSMQGKSQTSKSEIKHKAKAACAKFMENIPISPPRFTSLMGNRNITNT